MNRPVCAVSICTFLASLAVSVHAADVSGDKGKAGKLVPFNRVPVHPPKDTPDAATKNLAKAKIPAGFTADIWASEPLLANPVAFCFDPQGRMFVSETHRYRSSVLDIRHYMFMLEDDLAARNQDDWLKSIQKNFPNDWQQLEKESEVIRLVEDSNGDGKADKTSVYAEGFNSALDGIASGVLWDNGSLYFTNIPALWKLSGKDKAEKREELHRGYGVRFSYTGHDFHGLAKGPDGRIYFSIGDRGASIKTKEGGHIEVPDEGAVFRCEPDGSRLELVMRGLRNPQELAFDDYGNLFTGDNDSDQGDRERWVYVVEGGDAGWRIGWQHHPLGKEFNPWLAEHMWEPRDAKKKQPAYVLSPIANLPDGPSGLVYYPGTGLPAEYAGSYFLAGYKGSTAKSNVSTFKSVPDGAGFKLEGLKTFIDNVQATDVDFGPDSRFYVSAWDEGWERSDQGRIYRLSHEAARKEQAAQIAEVQKILGEGFEKKTPEELIDFLAHADQRVRLGAQWTLAAKMAVLQPTPEALKVSSLLAKTVENGSNGTQPKLSKLHAIWAMGHATRLISVEKLKAKPDFRLSAPKHDQVRARYENPDADIREHWISSIADNPAPFSDDLVQLYASKLGDQSPRVRFAAAMALAKKGNPAAVPAILQMLRENDGQDQYLQHAGVMALARCANGDALAAASKDANRHVRLAVVLAAAQKVEQERREFDNLPRNPNGSITVITATSGPKVKPAWEVMADGLADADEGIVADAARVISDSGAGQARLAKLDVSTTKDRMLAVRVLNANFRTGKPENATALAEFAAGTGSESLRVVALEMLAHWGEPPARDHVIGIYRPLKKREATPAAEAIAKAAARLLDGKSEKVTLAACEAIEANGVKTAGPTLLGLVQNTKAGSKARRAALDALAKLGTPELAMALSIAANDADAALKTEASKLLGQKDPATAAKQLAAAFAGAAVPEKKQILNALGDNTSPEAGKALAALMADFAKVPAPAKLELLEAAAKRPEAKEALAKYEASIPKDDLLAKFAATLEGGDATVGKKVFNEHAVAACMRCHKVGGQGGDAGPVLDGIAKTKDRRFLLESIVNVNATIADGFQMVVLTLKDGNVVAGYLKKETDEDLTIQAPSEQPRVVKKADVKQRDTAPSGMLPNLADFLTKRELRDIIEYCATLK